MKYTLSRLFLGLAIFVFPLSILGNEILLKNGDRLSGKIIEETETSVTIETDYAGKIAVSRAYVTKITETVSNRPVESVPIAAAATETAPVVASVPAEAPKPVPPKEPARPIAAKPPAAGKPAAPVAKPRLFDNGFMGLIEGWEGNANVGFSYTSGNSQTSTMTTGLRASKKGKDEGLNVYVRSHWHSNRGTGRMITTQNAFWGGGRYDRTINRKVFGFVSYDFERDRPKNLFFRSVVGAGLGHNTIKNDRTELNFLLGAGWNRTWQKGPNSDTPEALAGSTLKHRFHDKLKFQNTFTYFQNVTDISERRFVFDATVSADITKRIGVFVTVGDRFNNDPSGTTKKNDFLFTTGMKWNFGKKK